MMPDSGPRGLDSAPWSETRDSGGADWETGARRLGGNMGGGRTPDRTGSSKQLDRTAEGVQGCNLDLWTINLFANGLLLALGWTGKDKHTLGRLWWQALASGLSDYNHSNSQC